MLTVAFISLIVYRFSLPMIEPQKWRTQRNEDSTWRGIHKQTWRFRRPKWSRLNPQYSMRRIQQNQGILFFPGLVFQGNKHALHSWMVKLVFSFNNWWLSSGKRLHSELENHHAMNGKNHELSTGPFSSSQTVRHYQRVYQPYPEIIHRLSIYKSCISHISTILTIYQPWIYVNSTILVSLPITWPQNFPEKNRDLAMTMTEPSAGSRLLQVGSHQRAPLHGTWNLGRGGLGGSKSWPWLPVMGGKHGVLPWFYP